MRLVMRIAYLAGAAALAVLLMGSSSAAAVPAGVVLLHSTLRVDRTTRGVFAHAELVFKVYQPPQSGEFDMRLQEFRPRDDEWITKGEPTKKNVADTTTGETFTMRRSWECSGDLSWRIRLFVAPGIAQDGTPTPPETVFYPSKAGKQLDCDSTGPGRAAVLTAAAAQTPITGPLRIAGRAGQTITATYKCSVPPPGAMWGVGNDGNGTVANITPDGAGVYTVKLIRERELVWISNPNGQCASIQVRVIGRDRRPYPRPNIMVIQTRRDGAWTARCHSVHILKNGTDTIYAAGGCLPPKHIG